MCRALCASSLSCLERLRKAAPMKITVQALRTWHPERPHLFVKRVYYQAGLDTYAAGLRVLVVGQSSGETQSLLPL